MKDVVKLAAWTDRASHTVLYLNPSGDMFLLTIDAHVIVREVYPLKLEVFSAARKLGEVCPYISFVHNMNKNIYYLDMGDKVTFWSQIVFLENLGLSIDTEVFNAYLLKQDAHLHYEIARGICTKNQTVTFYHKSDYSKVPDYEAALLMAQGVLTVEFQPSLSGKTCDSQIKLTHLRVGCPPEKRIEVSGKPSECENFTFTIPWQSLRDPENKKDVEIHYNVETYGCPIQVHYQETYRPTVVLYMGDKPLGVVEANYVLWEMNGRTDFDYNSTMEEIQCLIPAQTWEKRLMSERINKTSTLTPERIDLLWGPQDYKSCFETNVEDLLHLDDSYEILNHSGINSLIWPQYQAGVYLFRLKIVDPNYSFCNLNTLFAVRTYGISQRPRWLLIFGLSAIILILLLGILVLSYFRYVKTFRDSAFEQVLTEEEESEESEEED